MHLCMLTLCAPAACICCSTVQLEKRIEADIIVARTLIAQKKKERALLALKKKKLSENQLQNIQAYLMNVEGMVSTHGRPILLSLHRQSCCNGSASVSAAAAGGGGGGGWGPVEGGPVHGAWSAQLLDLASSTAEL